MRRGLNVLVRSATGLISGAMDTSIELSSGVARLFDYGFESLGGDLLDDDSGHMSTRKDCLRTLRNP